MTLALNGIKVVELAQLAAAPMAGRHLADMGAEVIHIEHPVRGDTWRGIMVAPGDTSTINWNWENYSRNKKSVTIDVFKPGGKEIITKLIQEADVFLTNMRPFELEESGLQYGALNTNNPGLIYASLTGFGKEGPDKNEPGYDHTAYWARSGIAHMVMPDNIPPDFRVGAFGDNLGGMALAFGITAALFARERTGLGQEVDISLFNLGVYQLSFSIAQTLMTGQEQVRIGRKEMPNALMNTFQTRDRRWLLLSILQPDRYWGRLCQAIDRPELENDPRFESFMSRIENHITLLEILEETFSTRTLEEWKTRLAGIPFAPIQNLQEVVTDQQAKENDFFATFDHPTFGPVEMVANPIKLSKTPATIRTRAPEFSEHTEEVLLDLGYSWDEIAGFKKAGVIA